MAINYGFFNSVDGDRKYSAEDIGRYLKGIINSGVYPDSTTSLQVLAGSGMEVEVQVGRAMLDYHYLENTEPYVLTLSNGGTLGRIDAIVARLDLNNRLCEIAVKEGTPAAAPQAPTMSRTDVKKEYMLASVYVAALATSITQDNITDTRADTTVCGWVRGVIKQEVVSIPVPTSSTALYIPTVNENGDGYELMPTDTTLSFAGAIADAKATGDRINAQIGAATDYVDTNKVDKTHIVNNFTTTTEGYVADARGLKTLNDKFNINLLWTNASPTSTFAPQNITIDVSQYKLLLFVFRPCASYELLDTAICVKGQRGWLSSVTGSAGQAGAYAFTVWRQIAVNSTGNNNVVIYTGYRNGKNNMTPEEENNYAVPYRIYGIKGGITT